MEQPIRRIGNWYNVNLDGKDYQVLIQKEMDKVTCDPSTIIVFLSDENFGLKYLDPIDMNVFNIYDKIELMMKSMDWEYDLVE